MDIRHIGRRIAVGEEPLLVLRQDRYPLKFKNTTPPPETINFRVQVGVVGNETATMSEVANNDAEMAACFEHPKRLQEYVT